MNETVTTNESPPKAKRPRGTGSVYRRGHTWWLSYSRDGRQFNESSGSRKQSDPAKLLKERQADITRDEFVSPKARKTTVALAADFLAYYQAQGLKSFDDARTRWTHHLETFFRGRRANQVQFDLLLRYVNQRRAEGAATATIARELAVLHKAYSLGVDSNKVRKIPKFPRLKENNVRKGFVEDGQRQKLLDGAPFWFRCLVETARTVGWRHGELLAMRRRQVDLPARTLTLDAGTTKNGKARIAYLTEPLYILLRELVHGKQPDDHVFTRPNGRPVCDFRATWYKACARAGVGRMFCKPCGVAVRMPDRHCPNCGKKWAWNKLRYSGLIFHDLRRSAVRDMVRGGISEKVAMTISGHITRSVFDRYNIISGDDLKEAARKQEIRDRASSTAISTAVAPESGHVENRLTLQ